MTKKGYSFFKSATPAAVYLDDTGWFTVDPTGNKPGINSQFTPDKEQLAYPTRPELGEVNYPNVFTKLSDLLSRP